MRLNKLYKVINEALEINEDEYEVKELPEGNFVLFNKTKQQDGLQKFLTRDEAEEECKFYNSIKDEDEESEDISDMIQCVIKVEDIGNAFEYKGMILDNTDFMSQYDVDVEYQDRLEGEDPTIQFILAYHNDGDDKHFYDENGDSLELDFTEEEEFEQALKDKNESPDNTVIPDKENLE